MTRDYMRPVFQPEEGFGMGFKWIFGICLASFVLMQINLYDIASFMRDQLWLYIGEFAPWQLLTYMFIHEDPVHLLFNLISLFFFGNMAEGVFGTKTFVRYYLLCGIGGGLGGYLFYFFVGVNHPVIGASGALYGVMYACYRFFPDQIFNFFMIFPIKLKYLVMLLGLISFVMLFDKSGNQAHYAHLGGLVTGFLYFRFGDKANQWLLSFRQRKERNEFKRNAELKVQVDEILAKISREGMGALNAKEKKLLQEASKKFTKT